MKLLSDYDTLVLFAKVLNPSVFRENVEDVYGYVVEFINDENPVPYCLQIILHQ